MVSDITNYFIVKTLLNALLKKSHYPTSILNDAKFWHQLAYVCIYTLFYSHGVQIIL